LEIGKPGRRKEENPSGQLLLAVMELLEVIAGGRK
jgi:hypothetical protein